MNSQPDAHYFQSQEFFDVWLGVMGIAFYERYDQRSMPPTNAERVQDIREDYLWVHSQMDDALWQYAEPLMAEHVHRIEIMCGVPPEDFGHWKLTQGELGHGP
jgi:hypothetical protein